MDLPPWISSPSDLNNNESKKNIGSTKVDEKRKRKLENLDEDDCVSDMQDEEYLPWKIARRNKYVRSSLFLLFFYSALRSSLNSFE